MLQRSRKLEYYERFYVCRNTKDYYSNFNITCKYNHNVTSNTLSQALRSMIQKNVWHTYSVFKYDDLDDAKANGHNWELRDVGKIQFDDVVRFEKIKVFGVHTLAQVNDLKCQMNLENHPLWKIIVFEQDDGHQYLCIYFDHIIYDGLSAVQFHKDLIKELSEINDEDIFEEYIFDFDRDSRFFPESPIASSVEQSDLLKPTLYDSLKFYAGSYFGPTFNLFDYFKSKIYSPPFEPNLSVNPLYSPLRTTTKNRYQIVNFSPDQVCKIRRDCKIKNVTMTPYLHAIALQCIEEVLHPKVNPEAKYSSKSFTAINLRRYFPEGTPFKYGVYVSIDSTTISPILGRIEQVTHLLHSKLNNQIKFGEVTKPVKTYSFVNLWDTLKSVSELTEKCSLTISNLGRISDSEPNIKYKIVDAIFGLTTGRLYNQIMNLITTDDGGMNVTFGHIHENTDFYEGKTPIMDVFAETFKKKSLSIPH